jgi:hypothetical protein
MRDDMKHTLPALVAAMLILTGGCKTCSPVGRDRAIHLARSAAIASGHTPRKYEVLVSDPNPNAFKPTWFIMFRGTNGVVGNHFIVNVDPKTGDTQLIPGM